MKHAIFRQAALDRLSTPEELDQALHVARPTGWLAMVAVAVLVGVAGVWSLVSTVPVKVDAQGILLNMGGLLDVVPAADGRVARFLARPGDTVRVGDVVAILEQPDLLKERENASAELKEMTGQLEQVRQFNARDIKLQDELTRQKEETLRQSLIFLEDRLRWLRERENYEGELLKKQIIGRQRTIDTRIEINNAHEEIARTNNILKQLELEDRTIRVAKERELLNLELHVNKLRRQVEILDERLERRSRVLSPYAGHVVELKVNPGEVVTALTPLFSMITDEASPTADSPASKEGTGASPESGAEALLASGRLVAVLFVAPEHGKKVRSGMTVQILPTTVKRQEYGYMRGRVRWVAEVPSSEEGMMRSLKNRQLVQQMAQGGAPFEVVVELLPDPDAPGRYQWSSQPGPAVLISSGTLCEGLVTVRDLHVISLIIPALEPWLDPAARWAGPAST